MACMTQVIRRAQSRQRTPSVRELLDPHDGTYLPKLLAYRAASMVGT